MRESIALPSMEQRQAERCLPLSYRRGAFRLSVEVHSAAHAVLALRDVSPFGVGVESDRPVEKGRHIRLIYREADLVLTVAGTVVWCRRVRRAAAGGEGMYYLGIEFHPSDMAKNTRFFRHISGMQPEGS